MMILLALVILVGDKSNICKIFTESTNTMILCKHAIKLHDDKMCKCASSPINLNFLNLAPLHILSDFYSGCLLMREYLLKTINFILEISMENDSNLNTTVNESVLVLVPIGAVAFAPFLLLELVAAIVSNAILLALVILVCIKKLNNNNININIYLFSLAIGGLMGAFEICLISLVIARSWVLGTDLCSMNFFNMIAYNAIFVLIYLLISLDKLKGVKDPLRGRPTNKKASVALAVVWAVAIMVAIWGRNNV